MNILCLDQFSELGGAQRCLLDLLPALAGQGWGVHVAAPGSGELLARAAAMPAAVSTIRCGPYSSGRKTALDMARFAVELPRLASGIRALVRDHRADLVYVNGPRLLPAAALAIRRGTPLLFHSHSLLAGYALRLAGWSVRHSRAAVVACCRFVARPLEPYAGGVTIVYNGVCVAHTPVSTRDESPRLTIGVIGRISPEKGQAEFLRAARLLHHGLPGAHFLVCGAPLLSDAAAVRYAQQVRDLAAGLHVEFTGWQPDVSKTLAGLDLLVVPSTSVEATPRVILEAFAAGVPVLAYASGGIPEIVEHNVTGFLVEQRTPEALAAAMHGALQQPQRMRDVAAQARLKVSRDFTLEHYQQQMLAAIEAAVLH